VVTTPVTTTPVVTTIPDYSYTFFYGDYVPYYEGWFFYSNEWIWGGRGPRPHAPPRWIPPPREPHRPILIGPREPAPIGRRIDSSSTVIIRPQSPENPVVPSQHRIPRRDGR